LGTWLGANNGESAVSLFIYGWHRLRLTTFGSQYSYHYMMREWPALYSHRRLRTNNRDQDRTIAPATVTITTNIIHIPEIEVEIRARSLAEIVEGQKKMFHETDQVGVKERRMQKYRQQESLPQPLMKRRRRKRYYPAG